MPFVFSFSQTLSKVDWIIEPLIRTRDSYDKSRVVIDHDQTQYQICSIPLTPLQPHPSPPSPPQGPAQTPRWARWGRTVGSAATWPTSTSPAPPCPAPPTPPRTKTYPRPRSRSGGGTGSSSTSSGVLSVRSPRRGRWSRWCSGRSWLSSWRTLEMKFRRFWESVHSS